MRLKEKNNIHSPYFVVFLFFDINFFFYAILSTIFIISQNEIKTVHIILECAFVIAFGVLLVLSFISWFSSIKISQDSIEKTFFKKVQKEIKREDVLVIISACKHSLYGGRYRFPMSYHSLYIIPKRGCSKELYEYDFKKLSI